MDLVAFADLPAWQLYGFGDVAFEVEAEGAAFAECGDLLFEVGSE